MPLVNLRQAKTLHAPLIPFLLLAAILGVAGVGQSAVDVGIDIVWIGRSAEAPGATATTVAGGMALPLDANQAIFDNGDFTPAENRKAVSHGVQWGSWPHWGPECGARFPEYRRFGAVFAIPPALDVDGVRLALQTPYELTRPEYGGKILPVNDNIFVFINGVEVYHTGTDYDRTPVAYSPQTGGLVSPGALPSSASAGLVAGLNTLDLVVAETCGWGGMDRLVITVST